MRFQDLHRNIKIRMAVAFAFGIAQATTTPFMAIYFAKSFGDTLTGILLTVSIATSMLSGFVGGYYADRVGRRKLLILSEGVFLIAYLAMALANSTWLHAPILTFIAYLVTNVCWGIYGPVDEAMILDVTDAGSRQYVYGMFYWLFNLTMALGASIGAITFESYRFELFTAMSMVLAGTLLTTVLFIEETYHPTRTATAKAGPGPLLLGMARNYMSVLRDAAFLRYTLAGMLVTALEFQLQNYIGIRLDKQLPAQTIAFLNWQIHIDGVNILGFLQTENTVLVVLLASIAARVAGRFTDGWVLRIGVLFTTIGYSVMTITSVPGILFLAMFVATIGEVTSVSLRQAYLGDLAPEHARSSYLAVNSMTFGGSRVLASLGVIVGAYLPVWGMGMLSMLVGLAGLALYQTIVPTVHARRREETVSF